MSWIKEFFQFALKEKKLFLIPMIVMLLLLTVFIIFFESAAIAPFIYTLF